MLQVFRICNYSNCLGVLSSFTKLVLPRSKAVSIIARRFVTALISPCKEPTCLLIPSPPIASLSVLEVIVSCLLEVSRLTLWKFTSLSMFFQNTCYGAKMENTFLYHRIMQPSFLPCTLECPSASCSQGFFHSVCC